MREIIKQKFYNHSITYQNLFCAFFVTAIFSFRWTNCLPFSGYMPVSPDYDTLGFWGRYIIYAQEPFSFPIGDIKNLSFPFQAANIARGSLPIFAIPLKLLSKVFPYFAEFYYFVFIELLCVFFTAIFTFRLMAIFQVVSFWVKLLGVVLIALSFPLLFRSSFYFGATVHVIHFPIYLAFVYYYIQINSFPNLKTVLKLALIFVFAALSDYYVLMGISIIFCCFLVFGLVEVIFNCEKKNISRLAYSICAFVLAMSLYSGALFILGNESNLESPSRNTLVGKYRTGWGYGGGFGGGFHVADILTIVIPPKDSDPNIPVNRVCGPSSYLTNIGFPITTNDLQDGQYEGFTYLGTTTIGIIVALLLYSTLQRKRPSMAMPVGFKMKLQSKFFIKDNLFSLAVIIGVSTFILYVLSWGYIIHIGGVRFNDIPTPSYILAMVWPKFMFARSLGRLAMPFMMFITMAAVIYSGKVLNRHIYRQGKIRECIASIIIVLLVATHIYETRGYLIPPEVTRGNEIANIFNYEDRKKIRELLHDKKALMLVPELHHKLDWGKICYSLAFYSNIPVSGATIGAPGERAEHLRHYTNDVNQIMTGNVKQIFSRYGNVAIAAPPAIAGGILQKANRKLLAHKLHNQDVVLLTSYE